MTNRFSKLKSARGFTLLELMITVVVTAILAGLAIPSFNNFMVRHRLLGAVEGLYADLQFARSEAVKRNRSVQIVISQTRRLRSQNWSYVISARDNICPLGSVVTPPMKTVSGTEFLNTRMWVNNTFRAGATIVFQPASSTVLNGCNGGTPSDAIVNFRSQESRSFWSNHDKLACLHISRFGRTKLCSPSGDQHLLGLPECSCRSEPTDDE